ncbi:MAG: DNA mismatch repair protein MutS [Deltaproteobacteria bacterium]|nr:DNA mismatch repair protein MutS [Deltaproteobacteria bacterium]
MSTQTPLMRQYLETKEKYRDAILFFRLGDFYEMFFDDAERVSKMLNLTLTSRNKSSAESVPLCGVPHHSAQTYINRLISMGHKVALCEQMEDPKKAKGIVKREVVQVITPGVMLDPEGLDGKNPNYLASVCHRQGRWGLALADVSTGLFQMTELADESKLSDELNRLEPREILLPVEEKNRPWAERLRKNFPAVLFNAMPGWHFDPDFGRDLYQSYYKASLAGLGIDSLNGAYPAGGALLSYLSEMKLLKEGLLSRPRIYFSADSMAIDDNAKRNLELVTTLAEGKRHGSLFWLIDRAKTVMGSRQLKNWLLSPLIESKKIEERLSVVSELKENSGLLSELENEFSKIADLERLENRIVAGQANARDLIALCASLERVDAIKNTLSGCGSPLLCESRDKLDSLNELTDEIGRTLCDDPPPALKEGGIIREGVNAELDELRSIEKNGKYFISTMEAREREATGISSLKIRYNQVFGYAIEITHTHKDKIPQHYIRKQTLTQAERYITPELKEYEEKVLRASERICELEYEIFQQLREKAAGFSVRIKKTAETISTLDALMSLARVALEYRYVRPEIVDEPALEIKKGRHPLVEALYREEPFVPNDLLLNTSDQRLLIITGPNMAGKSTVMRQTALIVIMAQMGGFVPAESAMIGIVDQIFTRVGASDRLQKGHSTFMVEMIETANILAHATEKSLVVLDEIGRGTSTFDGLSIAWAVAETLHDKIACRTLFATHYHELTDLAEEKEGIRNFHMAVKEWNGEILFLRELKEGGTNRSYGVFVAAMAGLPPETISRAREILKLLEEKDLQFKSAAQKESPQMTLFEPRPHPVVEELKKVDINALTPLEALNVLARLKTSY